MIQAADIQNSSAIRSIRRLLQQLDAIPVNPCQPHPLLETLAQELEEHTTLTALLQTDPFAPLTGTEAESLPAGMEQQHSKSAAPVQNKQEKHSPQRASATTPTESAQPRSRSIASLSSAKRSHAANSQAQAAKASVRAEALAEARADEIRSLIAKPPAGTGAGLVAQLLQQHNQRPAAKTIADSSGLSHPTPSPSPSVSATTAPRRNLTETMADVTKTSARFSTTAQLANTQQQEPISSAPTSLPKQPEASPGYSLTSQQPATTGVLQDLVAQLWPRSIRSSGQQPQEKAAPNTLNTAPVKEPARSVNAPAAGAEPEYSDSAAHSFAGELQQLIGERRLLSVTDKTTASAPPTASTESPPLTADTNTTIGSTAAAPDDATIVAAVSRALRTAARRNGVDLP